MVSFLKFNFPTVKIAQSKTQWHIHNRNLSPSTSVRLEFKLPPRTRYGKLTNQLKILSGPNKTLERVAKVNAMSFIFVLHNK